jgi:hypothetical protein
MKTWILAAALALLALPCSALAQSRDALIGTWKLVSSTDTTEKGATRDTFGQNPTGFLTYTADGRVMAIISHGGRKPLSTPDYIAAPAEERAAAFATFTAYAGTFTLDGNRVIHHVQISSLQNRVDTDLVRTLLKLDGDQLILRTPPTLRGGVQATTVLVWQRLKGEAASH